MTHKKKFKISDAFYPKRRSASFLRLLLSVTCESPGEKGFESCRLLYGVKQQLCVHLLNKSKKIVKTFLDASKSEPGERLLM